jgi:hypothetical protein
MQVIGVMDVDISARKPMELGHHLFDGGWKRKALPICLLFLLPMGKV